MAEWPILDALADRHAAGRGVREWSVYLTESRRVSLGIKDRHAGNAHAPLSISESCAARYLFVWNDGLVSRGSFERTPMLGTRPAFAKSPPSEAPVHTCQR